MLEIKINRLFCIMLILLVLFMPFSFAATNILDISSVEIDSGELDTTSGSAAGADLYWGNDLLCDASGTNCGTIGGGGTQNYIPYWSSATALGDSSMTISTNDIRINSGELTVDNGIGVGAAAGADIGLDVNTGFNTGVYSEAAVTGGYYSVIDTSGDNTGLHAYASASGATESTGIYARASSNNGEARGIYAYASASGTGIDYAVYADGNDYGVYSSGIVGGHFGGSATGIRANGISYSGYFMDATTSLYADGTTYSGYFDDAATGIYAVASSYGVYVLSPNTGLRVSATTSLYANSSYAGIYSYTSDTTGSNYGGYFRSYSDGTNTDYGIYALGVDYGVYANGGTGVYAESGQIGFKSFDSISAGGEFNSRITGVRGHGNTTGVYGRATDTSSTNYGVYGVSSSSANIDYAVYGDGVDYSGYFASAATGLYADGVDYSGYFDSATTGIRAIGTTIGGSFYGGGGTGVSASGTTYGVSAYSDTGSAVFGESDDGGYGGYFTSTATGIYATGTTGLYTTSTSSYGVYIDGTDSPVTGIQVQDASAYGGVFKVSDSSGDNTGVYGYASASGSGNLAYGVYAGSASDSSTVDYGVFANGADYSGYFTTAETGVYATGTVGISVSGTRALHVSSAYTGIIINDSSMPDPNTGIYIQEASSYGLYVGGTDDPNTGVYVEDAAVYGGYFSVIDTGADNTGVYAVASSSGTGNIAYGVYASSAGSFTFDYGVYANGADYSIYGASATYAGYFAGSVHVTGTLTKVGGSFVQPHPEDASKEISYGFFEGPEQGVYIRGTIGLINGEGVINVPDHFRFVAYEPELTVQVTPLSASSLGVAVIEKNLRQIRLKELHDGTGSYDVDYFVTSVRLGFENQTPVGPNKHFVLDTDGVIDDKDNLLEYPIIEEDGEIDASSRHVREVLKQNGVLKQDGKINKEKWTELGWKIPKTKEQLERDRLKKYGLDEEERDVLENTTLKVVDDSGLLEIN